MLKLPGFLSVVAIIRKCRSIAVAGPLFRTSAVYGANHKAAPRTAAYSVTGRNGAGQGQKKTPQRYVVAF